ncbi:hypothetical protein Tco_0960643 [Tanacetum coccineum]
MRSFGAVGSTIHSMIKFPTNQGIVIMKTSRETLWEYRQLERVQGSWKEVQWRQREEQMSRIKEQVILRTKNSSGRGLNFGLLKIYPLAELIAHKRRPMAPEGRLAFKEKVFRWLKEGLIRKVQHPEWIANTIPIKLANETWKVQVDYSSLNKVCAKDMYPFSEEGEGLASIMGYSYKCFLRLPKEYNQIRMAEDDKEKTGFHTEKGLNLVEDVEETLRKLKRVNIKIDLVTSSFGAKEGRFLGHMVRKEGVGADPEKAQAIILSPTPKSSNQIRNLFLQLTAISKFIPKVAKLQYPIRRVRIRSETAEGIGWTNEAEEALQRIKIKLNKLQTFVVPKEGEILMLCLCHKDKTISSVLLVEREGIQIPISYVKVVTDGPMEEILKLSGKKGRLAKWAAEIRTYDILYIPRKEAERSVVKKFFGQGEQVEETSCANERGTLNLSKEFQEKSTPAPRAWKLYLGPEEKDAFAYAIRLKFNTSDHVIDCEALLAGLAVSVSKVMKDLHVFIDSPKLVA